MSGIAETVVASRPTWPTLASFVRTRVLRGLQQVLKEEVDALSARHKVNAGPETPRRAIATASGTPANSRC